MCIRDRVKFNPWIFKTEKPLLNKNSASLVLISSKYGVPTTKLFTLSSLKASTTPVTYVIGIAYGAPFLISSFILSSPITIDPEVQL